MIVIGTEFIAIGTGQDNHLQSTCQSSVQDLADNILHKLACSCITFILLMVKKCVKYIQSLQNRKQFNIS